MDTQHSVVLKSMNDKKFQDDLNSWLSKGYRLSSSFCSAWSNGELYQAILVVDLVDPKINNDEP